MKLKLEQPEPDYVAKRRRMLSEVVPAEIERQGGNCAAAARALGVTRITVYRYRDRMAQAQ